MQEPPRPFELGDRIRDEEGDEATFLRYSETGYFGYFAYRGPTDIHKLPIAGLKKIVKTPVGAFIRTHSDRDKIG